MDTAECKRQVLRYAKSKGMDIAMPRRGSPEIIVTLWRDGKGEHIADGTTWRQIFDALRAWQAREFNL